MLEATTVAATFIDGELMWCGHGLDDWCAGFGQPIPTRILDESLMPLQEGDLGPPPSATVVEGLAVSASSSRDGHLPELVLDGLIAGESFWSSGQDAPGWIQVDFDEPATLEGLRFVVFQNPSSDTIHVLELLVGGVWSEAHRFEGFTMTGDVLEWMPGTPTLGVEAFRMTTTESASWPEWYEIEVTRR